MKKKKLIILTIGILFISCLLGCPTAGSKGGVDEAEIQGFKTKTFYDSNENIEIMKATDGNTTIVAVPLTSISRIKKMSDEEYKCLAACVPIKDLEKRLNCILLCPVTKQYRVFIY